MKTVILGDTHGRSVWKLIVQRESPDRAIFIGDYFDTHDDVPGLEQLKNFEEICSFKRRSSDIEVIMDIGNHDYHYFPEIGYTGCSGYQSSMKTAFEGAIDRNRDLLQMAYQFDDILCSHAGISEVWLKETGWGGEENVADYVNSVWRHRPMAFHFSPSSFMDTSGDSSGQTPIWIRPHSLISDSRELAKKYKQIVGHTSMKNMDLEKYGQIGYYFIDTLGTSGEYLVYEDGVFTKGSWR